jgi:hypothetical protein
MSLDPVQLRLDNAAMPDRRCGGCGYLLTGLAPEGECPECGIAYRADELVLCGWAGKGRETIANVPTSRLALSVLAVSPYLWIIGLLEFFAYHRVRGIVYLSTAAAFSFPYLWRRWFVLGTADHPCFVVISPRGFQQRDGPGEFRPLPWISGGEPEVIAIKGGGYLLNINDPRGAGRGYLVSLQFECSPLQADNLRLLLCSMRNGLPFRPKTESDSAFDDRVTPANSPRAPSNPAAPPVGGWK